MSLLALLLLGGAGCAAPMLALSERETEAILAELQGQVDAERAAARQSAEDMERQEAADVEVPEVLGLEDALRIAAAHNRDLESSREGLVLSAVSLRNARRDVGPRLAGSLSYLLSDDEDSEERRTDGGSLSLTDTLPTGAELRVSADAEKTHGRGDLTPSGASGSWSARLTQPLLRDAGYESSHESLTDAEREALYDVRAFELSRQDLALRVQREFYAIVSQKKVIANRELTLENFDFLRRRSERLFEVDRVSEVDKFRAAREFLSAENDLVDARQEYESRLDRLKILLGLDTSVQFDVADDIPAPRDVEFDLRTAFEIALRNRLEVMTARNRVEDAERRVRIRKRDLLPRVDLEAVRTRASDPERRFRDLHADRDSYSVGIAVELPLDRVRERGALRAANIELDRSRRALSLEEDNVVLDVRESWRDLRSARNSLKIQEQIVASEEKNEKVAQLRFEQGEIGNRDLTDAIVGLADARDRLVRERANVETARLQLLRDLGILTMEEDGTWVE